MNFLAPVKTIFYDKKGFSLLELLVAMALLSILVVMMTTLFNNSIAAFNVGTQRAEMNMSARAALEYIARELSSAVAGDADGVAGKKIEFKLDTAGSDAKFFTLTNTNKAPYSSRMFCVRYDQANGILEAYHDSDANPYTTTPSWGASAILIENVLDFSIVVYSSIDALTNGAGMYLFDSTLNPEQNLPVCADVILELMSADDMKRYRTNTVNKDDYRKKNSRIYSTRVFFNNRHISVKNLKYEQ